MLSYSEENYLKSIYTLSTKSNKRTSTNAISDKLKTTPASVTDMIQKLANKGLASYYKYRGVRLTDLGRKEALKIVRKHRLWEVFLAKKLNFNWNEIHEIAEQLEHIKSPQLIERLEKFLGYPKFDPHGDPIPDSSGKVEESPTVTLSMLKKGYICKVICAKDSSHNLLSFLDKLNISIGSIIEVIDRFEFDSSYSIKINKAAPITISNKVAQNIYIKQL